MFGQRCRVYVRGGLGNQLSSLCAAFAVLEREPDRTSLLEIDASVVSSSTDPERRYQLHNFHLVDDTGRVTIVERIPKNTSQNVTYTFRRRTLHLRNRLWAVHPKASEFITSLHAYAPSQSNFVSLDGHFESTAIATLAVKLGLNFPLKLVNPSAQYREELAALQADTVGVHVRLTDYSTWMRGRHLLGAGYYRRALGLVGGLQRGVSVRVFSDDPSAATRLIKEAGVPEKLILVSSLLNPAEAMMSLSQHRRIVISQSTFSWWAAYMSVSSTIVHPIPSATLESPSATWIGVSSQA